MCLLGNRHVRCLLGVVVLFEALGAFALNPVEEDLDKLSVMLSEQVAVPSEADLDPWNELAPDVYFVDESPPSITVAAVGFFVVGLGIRNRLRSRAE